MDTLMGKVKRWGALWAGRVWALVKSLPGLLTVAAAVVTLAAPQVTEMIAATADAFGVEWGWLESSVADWAARVAGWMLSASVVFKRVVKIPEDVAGWESEEKSITITPKRTAL